MRITKPQKRESRNMKRKIYNRLQEWKNQSNGTSAVLIEGARRIGKSYIVEKKHHLSPQHFSHRS
ncbi:MAG: hypothetical protein PUC50_02325 [Bacteroidales bacterium]|nr:hypothetical protein [Bacteroidales bacterium]